jgi:hypothetical protein
MRIRTTHTMRLLVALLAVTMLAALPAVALAAGTGDYPNPAPDKLTPRETARKAALARTEERARRSSPGGIAALAMDAPYRFLWTTTHLQEHDHYCGPATVQEIVDYFGNPGTQDAFAKYMGTTDQGTSFTLVDDALRYYTGKGYYYARDLTSSAFNYKVADTIGNHGWPLAADVRIDAAVWPNYVYSHDGHIICLEGFDWRYNTIRLNDVYNEASYRSGGGSTGGHVTYNRNTVWAGVYAHAQRAVVAAQ